MGTVILFLLTFTEMAAVGASYVLQSQSLFNAVVMYGSPFYIIRNLLGRDSAFLERNPVYIGFAIFHLVKYICFFRSRRSEQTATLRALAVVMEAAYLTISAYYSL